MNLPRDAASRLRTVRNERKLDDGVIRETFTLPVEEARTKAREIVNADPVAGYMTIIEHWRQLTNGRIEFSMRSLPTAD